MPYFQFADYTDNRQQATFHQVDYIDGRMKVVSPVIFTMIMPVPACEFNAGDYYEIARESNNDQNLSATGWKSISPDEIVKAENEKIAAALETGQSPLPLSDAQQQHNQNAISAMEDFIKRNRKKK